MENKMDAASLEKLSISELEELQKKIEALKQKKLELDFKGKKILGFTLTRTERTVKGKKYPAWQAYCSIDGKRSCIHIGEDPRQAETKIKSHLEKNLKQPEKRQENQFEEPDEAGKQTDETGKQTDETGQDKQFTELDEARKELDEAREELRKVRESLDE